MTDSSAQSINDLPEQSSFFKTEKLRKSARSSTSNSLRFLSISVSKLLKRVIIS